MSGMTRLLVAEDDPLTLAGIKLLLSDTGYQVVGTARDGDAVLQLISTVRPDVLVLDFSMPRRSGLEVLRTLRERGDKRSIVMLTGGISRQNVYDALQLGLNGLVIKSSAPRDLITCLDTIVQGRRWIDHEALQQAMELSLDPEGSAAHPLHALTPREHAVVALLVRGLRNKQIAADLGIGEGTVKAHLHKVFEKLGVTNRSELIVVASSALE
jgi:two-component system, NarL family, nitrate/nitrite response regulator NarL